MMTETWWLNSELIVGMPRRSTEWSTESSCTSVARWISSTTAASAWPAGRSAAGRLVGQEQQRRPEHLALHLEQVGVHLGDEAEIGLDDAAAAPAAPAQPGPKRTLQVGQRDRRGLRRSFVAAPRVSRCMRSPRSMKRMSTAMARS